MESSQLKSILAFVSGAMRPQDFASELAAHPEEYSALLDDHRELPDPSYITLAGLKNTFEFLTTCDVATLGGQLNAQGALVQFLERRGIAYVATNEYSELLELLADSQPPWLDVDTEFLRGLLTDAPEIGKTARKKWLRERLKNLFRFATRPPRWIQSPEWPIRGGQPLVFLGQLAVKDYFHDAAAAYVFFDEATGRSEVVLQMY